MGEIADRALELGLPDECLGLPNLSKIVKTIETQLGNEEDCFGKHFNDKSEECDECVERGYCEPVYLTLLESGEELKGSVALTDATVEDEGGDFEDPAIGFGDALKQQVKKKKKRKSYYKGKDGKGKKPLDKFGFRIGTKLSETAELVESGKYSPEQIMDVICERFDNELEGDLLACRKSIIINIRNHLRVRGFKVIKDRATGLIYMEEIPQEDDTA